MKEETNIQSRLQKSPKTAHPWHKNRKTKKKILLVSSSIANLATREWRKDRAKTKLQKRSQIT